MAASTNLLFYLVLFAFVGFAVSYVVGIGGFLGTKNPIGIVSNSCAGLPLLAITAPPYTNPMPNLTQSGHTQSCPQDYTVTIQPDGKTFFEHAINPLPSYDTRIIVATKNDPAAMPNAGCSDPTRLYNLNTQQCETLTNTVTYCQGGLYNPLTQQCIRPSIRHFCAIGEKYVTADDTCASTLITDFCDPLKDHPNNGTCTFKTDRFDCGRGQQLYQLNTVGYTCRPSPNNPLVEVNA